MSSTQEPVLIRPAEAARLLSVSRATIYTLIAEGAVPSVRVGDRMIRVPAEAIRRMAKLAPEADAEDAR